jgi:hypothetical protein
MTEGASAAVGGRGAQGAPAMSGLPHRGVGWWAFGLLVVVGLFPLWWATVNRFVDNGLVMTALSLGLGAPAFLCSREAVFRKKDPSLLVNFVFFLVAAEVLIGMFFGLALLGQAFG